MENNVKGVDEIDFEITKELLDRINYFIETDNESEIIIPDLSKTDFINLFCDETVGDLDKETPEDNNIDREIPGGSNINNPTNFVLPIFGGKISPNWEVANPIFLTAKPWLGKNIDGINISPGFYKIKYVLSGIQNQGSGLALFDQSTRAFRELITWHTFNDKNKIIHSVGSTYLRVYKESILGITNNVGNLRPSSFKGVHIVNLLKQGSITPP